MHIRFRLTLLLTMVASLEILSQAIESSNSQLKPGDNGKDLIDIIAKILNSPSLVKHDSIKRIKGRIYFSGSPGGGYSLATGYAGIIASNLAFYNGEIQDQKLSNIYSDVVYTQRNQLILHSQGNVWTENNGFNLITDWRYLKYPLKTYGLGGHSSDVNAVNQDYSYVRLYQAVLKNLGHHFFAGIGYNFDYHWSITSVNADPTTISDVQKYGIGTKSTSSGLTLNFLYDNRQNSINPQGGAYFNVVYRPNFTFLGSDNNWQSLRIEAKKYYNLPVGSDNILGFWTFNWLTLGGNPPYLDLPSTGWDPYNNTGRGYVQGRFRGKNMIYVETEYRFKVSRNGLFGGVVFVNAQSFSEWPSGKYEVVSPGAGLGLRLKFNKHSRTNVAIDYGWGSNGSQGLFLNLGEVF